jgi:GGDEF domain-containing protein
MAALRHEPEHAAMLLKVGAAGPILVGVWVALGSLVLSGLIIAVVAFLLVTAYGIAVAVLAAGVVSASSAAMTASRRLAPSATRRHERNGAQIRAVTDEDDQAARHPAPMTDSNPFHVSYFVNRLREEVKNARRHGHEMSVVVLDVTIPGSEMTPEQAEAIAHEVARIASQHPQTISLQLAITDSEFMFSMPHSDAKATKEFVSQVIGALGRYWCHFGTASFPRQATSAEALVDAAREACEMSRNDGKPGQVRQAVSA